MHFNAFLINDFLSKRFLFFNSKSKNVQITTRAIYYQFNNIIYYINFLFKVFFFWGFN